MTVRIITADVMDGLAQLPDESVHCCVTSPPYWGLRDYGVNGQIGLEPTPEAFVARMVEVFREVKRVLRKDGTLWLNLGDSYNAGTAGPRKPTQTGKHGYWENPNISLRIDAAGLKTKDLIGIPWRVAFALQADGWWLRSDVIWHKPNPMPESVTDRPTKAHEYVFLLTRSERYFYDAEAIKEPAISARPLSSWDERKTSEPSRRGDPGISGHVTRTATLASEDGRNKRSVWSIPTAPFPEAHFATFPPELPEICIKAGTSQHGCCAKCGALWERETEKGEIIAFGGKGARYHGARMDDSYKAGTADDAMTAHAKITTGWSPSCSCNADVKPCTVLDPFAGAGTTGLVADRLQRNAILIELNGDYTAMIERRLSRDRGGLLDLMEAAE